MADLIPTETTIATDKVENWDPDTFAALIAVVRYKSDEPLGNLCKFTFLPKGCEVFVSNSGDEALVYNPVAVEIIKARYTQAMQLIDALIEKDFTIIRLEIASRKGISGVSFTFLTPHNRQHKSDYFLDNNEPESLIPDSFLHDLKMFPSRYG